MKTTHFLAIFFSLLAFSCKKEYPCECTVKQSFGGFSQNVTSTTMTPKMSKQEARDYCENYTQSNASGLSQSVDCKLKD